MLAIAAASGPAEEFGYTPVRGASSSGPAGLQEDGLSQLDRMLGQAHFGRGGF
jgi:hypothetical protein